MGLSAPEAPRAQQEAVRAVARLGAAGIPFAYLDPCGFADGWSVGSLLAPLHRPWLVWSPGRAGGLEERWEQLDVCRAERCRRWTPDAAGVAAENAVAKTGIVVLAGYEAWAPPGTPALSPAPGRPGEVGWCREPCDRLPRFAAWSVDRSVSWARDGRLELSGTDPTQREAALQWWHQLQGVPDPRPAPLQANGPLRTSLPRERYIRALLEVKRRIERGDIYQANLCQRFDVPVRGATADTFAALVERAPAPHAACLSTADWAVLSVSPERFVQVDRDGTISTEPIKGTRRRDLDPTIDAGLAAELRRSEKDRAELLMIVDLERNDLGRICRPGSVDVPTLAALRSFPTVHHLVATVRGQLAPDWKPSQLLPAVFPGGSISGAPKRRAIEILRAVEPTPRGFFTGCLFWFGDDRRVDSSILIRSLQVHDGLASIGAGGGIVADSEPEAEWAESNLKARVLLEVLGCRPEEAT